MKREGSFCLMDAPAGQLVRVSEIEADRSLRSHLYAMGILPGCQLEVGAACGGNGGRQIRVRNSSFVLGGAVARCVRCEVCGAEVCEDSWPRRRKSGCCGRR